MYASELSAHLLAVLRHQPLAWLIASTLLEWTCVFVCVCVSKCVSVCENHR